MPALCQGAVSHVVTLPLGDALVGEKGLASVLLITVDSAMPQRRQLCFLLSSSPRAWALSAL